MSKNITKGKLKHLGSSQELKFAMNPTEFNLNRSFNFSITSLINKASPCVQYSGTGVSQLSFKLIFDNDVDTNFKASEVMAFIKSIGRLDNQSASVSPVCLTWGSFKYSGYVSNYNYCPLRFDSSGEPSAIHLNFTLLSDGGFEDE